MIGPPDFPRLTPANYRVTSPASPVYNCVAWAAQDTEHWWQPGVYWPEGLPADDFGPTALEKAFLALGYTRCADGSLEPGFQKVALYADGAF